MINKGMYKKIPLMIKLLSQEEIIINYFKIKSYQIL